MSLALENTLLTRHQLKQYSYDKMKDFIIDYLNTTYSEEVPAEAKDDVVLQMFYKSRFLSCQNLFKVSWTTGICDGIESPYYLSKLETYEKLPEQDEEEPNIYLTHNM